MLISVIIVYQSIIIYYCGLGCYKYTSFSPPEAGIYDHKNNSLDDLLKDISDIYQKIY
jgi:hypothetical protein